MDFLNVGYVLVILVLIFIVNLPSIFVATLMLTLASNSASVVTVVLLLVLALNDFLVAALVSYSYSLRPTRLILVFVTSFDYRGIHKAETWFGRGMAQALMPSTKEPNVRMSKNLLHLLDTSNQEKPHSTVSIPVP